MRSRKSLEHNTDILTLMESAQFHPHMLTAHLPNATSESSWKDPRIIARQFIAGNL